MQQDPVHYQTVIRCEETVPASGMEAELYWHVFAPTMVEYIEWVLWEAAASGKRRLYFLARDGYPMYLVADALCRERHLDIECRYLKLSRYALRVPCFFLRGEACLDWICVDGIEVTFKKVMKRAALSETEMMEVAYRLGYGGRMNQKLERQELFSLKRQLQELSYFFECVYAHSRFAYDNAIGYLTQEGLFEDIPYALVDSGWTGTLQLTLEMLLDSRKPGNELEGYYFGLYELPRGRRKNYHAFYFVPESDIRRKVYFSNCLFEAVFSAPEPMTVAYERQGTGFVPVAGERENPNRERMERNAFYLRQYVKCYLECRLESGKCQSGKEKCRLESGACQTGNCCDNRKSSGGAGGFVEELLSRFMGKPETFEAVLYGNLLFSDDVQEESLQETAAVMSIREVRQQHFWRKLFIKLGISKKELRESAWMEGSIVRSGWQAEKYSRHIRYYKYFIYIRKTWKGVRNAGNGPRG